MKLERQLVARERGRRRTALAEAERGAGAVQSYLLRLSSLLIKLLPIHKLIHGGNLEAQGPWGIHMEPRTRAGDYPHFHYSFKV
jgi:hypothetical protein